MLLINVKLANIKLIQCCVASGFRITFLTTFALKRRLIQTVDKSALLNSLNVVYIHGCLETK